MNSNPIQPDPSVSVDERSILVRFAARTRRATRRSLGSGSSSRCDPSTPMTNPPTMNTTTNTAPAQQRVSTEERSILARFAARTRRAVRLHASSSSFVVL